MPGNLNTESRRSLKSQSTWGVWILIPHCLCDVDNNGNHMWPKGIDWADESNIVFLVTNVMITICLPLIVQDVSLSDAAGSRRCKKQWRGQCYIVRLSCQSQTCVPESLLPPAQDPPEPWAVFLQFHSSDYTQQRWNQWPGCSIFKETYRSFMYYTLS